MCSKYPGIKLESALQRYEDKIENLSSKQVISGRRKHENGYEIYQVII